jgi:hypothetical protein
LDAKEVAKVKGYLQKSSFITAKQTLVVSNKVNTHEASGVTSLSVFDTHITFSGSNC